MRKASRFIYTPIRILFIIVAAPILTVGYWLLSTVAIPLYIFRKLLTFTARVLDPDLCQVINTTGNMITRDYNTWSKSVTHAITVVFIINGTPTIDQIRQLFLNKLVHKKDLNYDKLEYPELQQKLTKRFGYLFFKWDRNFDICNHINIFSDKKLLSNGELEVVSEKTLMKIWETVSIKPFSQNRSPWDVHVIHNYVPNETKIIDPNEKQTVLMIRVHHGISDGFGVYRILLSLTDEGIPNLERDIPVYRKAPPCMNFLIQLKAFLFGPISLAIKVSTGFDIYNPLHRPLREMTGRTHIFTEKIGLETIKKISRVHSDVSFQSVLLAAVAGGVRNFLVGNGHSITQSPIRVGFALPKRGHTLKLRNDFYCTIMDLPVHKKTPKQRLFATEKRLSGVKNESFFPFMAQTWNIIGLSPVDIATSLTLKSAVTVTYSELKGPSKSFTLLNGKFRLLDLKYSFGLGADDMDVGFASLSYNGHVYIVLIVDHAVTRQRTKAQELMNLILKDLEELQYGDSTNL